MSQTITIIVNGREKTVQTTQLTFEAVVKLSQPELAGPNIVYTVTYYGGPEQNPEGSMVDGDVVFIKSRMVFNVTATDKS